VVDAAISTSVSRKFVKVILASSLSSSNSGSLSLLFIGDKLIDDRRSHIIESRDGRLGGRYRGLSSRLSAVSTKTNTWLHGIHRIHRQGLKRIREVVGRTKRIAI
jgi:hypothetical protein